MTVTRFIPIGVLLLSVLPVAAHDSAQANRLLVETAQLMEEAATKSGTDQVVSLQAALDKLHRIIENHASSDAAVRLITGQDIGFLALWKVEWGLVGALSAAGDVEGALTIAKRMSRFTRNDEGVPTRDMAFELVVGAQLRSGDLEGARTTANLIKEDQHREIILRGISMSR